MKPKKSKRKQFFIFLMTCLAGFTVFIAYNANRVWFHETESKLTGRALTASDDANQITPIDLDKQTNVRWKTTEVSVYIDPYQPDEYVSAYKSALKLWNSYNIIHFKLVDNPDQARIYLTRESLPDDKENYILLAVTYPRAYTRLNYLSFVDVKFNDTALFKDKHVTKSQPELISISVHELGHAIGLEHDNKVNTVMSTKSNINHDTYIDNFTLSRARKLYK